MPLHSYSGHSQLPYDIWLHITRFIPPLEIGQLYAVNSSLFNIAMDQRYRQISFAYLSPKMIRTLVRLKDPAVAKRVRIIYIHPHFVSTVKATPPVTSSSSSVYTRRLQDLAHHWHVCEQKLFGKKSSSLSEKKTISFKTPEDVVQVMTQILNGLPNVTDYHIAWSGLANIGDAPVPFLAAPLGRPNLTRLWLDVSLERLRSLLSYSNFTTLGNIEELDLFLRIEPEDNFSFESDDSECKSTMSDFESTLSEYLAPAISALSPTLRSLSIRLWQPLDLSPLFTSLEPLPRLSKIKLDIPMECPHLGSPLALAAWLNLHSHSLTHLSLRASQLNGGGLTPIDTSVAAWLGRVVPKVKLEQLQNLEMSLLMIPFESALICVKQWARTLTSLSLTGIQFEFSQLESLLSILSAACVVHRDGGLHSLKIGSVTLSPELIDIFALSLPSLRKLELLIREVVPSTTDQPIFYWGHPERDQDESQLGEFFENISRRDYACWALDKLWLLRSSTPFRLQFEERYREVFHGVIPTLRAIDFTQTL